MKVKPAPGATIVYRVENVWRGIFRVQWSDSLNYPRCFSTLFRKIDGAWTTGEDNPTGVHNSGLLRLAHPAIAEALDASELTIAR